MYAVHFMVHSGLLTSVQSYLDTLFQIHKKVESMIKDKELIIDRMTYSA